MIKNMQQSLIYSGYGIVQLNLEMFQKVNSSDEYLQFEMLFDEIINF